MSEKLKQYVAMAEIVSAVAVLITLVILIVEVRKNTDMLEVSAAAATRDSLVSSNDLVMQLGDDYLDLIVRSNDPQLRFEDLQPVERLKIRTFQRSFFRRAEAQFFNYRHGLLDESVWATVRGRVVVNIRSPIWVEMWTLDRESVYTQAFVEEIEAHLDRKMLTLAEYDNEQLDNIYRAFFTNPVDVDKIGTLYRKDIIHVSRPNQPLIVGRDDFLGINIAPLADMVNSGEIAVTGTVYVMRRTIIGDMANDVGYLYTRIDMPDAEPIEQLQKYSWVFAKDTGSWRVITDFDATYAPLDTLETIEPEFVIE